MAFEFIRQVFIRYKILIDGVRTQATFGGQDFLEARRTRWRLIGIVYVGRTASSQPFAQLGQAQRRSNLITNEVATYRNRFFQGLQKLGPAILSQLRIKILKAIPNFFAVSFNSSVPKTVIISIRAEISSGARKNGYEPLKIDNMITPADQMSTAEKKKKRNF